MSSDIAFDQWAVVELFGHSRIAGRVTEQTIGGQSFIRVDVPELDGRPAFTKLYGAGAIYAISPVEESVARHVATRINVRPVEPYLLPAGSAPAAESVVDGDAGASDPNDDDWDVEDDEDY